MMTMNVSIFKLYQEGSITLEDALACTDNENELQQMMRGAFHGSN